MTPEAFYSELEKFDIYLTDTQKKQFETYYHFLVTETKKLI